MNVTIGDRWQQLLHTAVESGRFESESDVVSEGLRLVEEREHKLQALRETINASIARGGSHTHEEVWRSVQATLDRTKAA